MTVKIVRVNGFVERVSSVCDHPDCSAEIEGGLRDGWQVHWKHGRSEDQLITSRRFDYCPDHAGPYRNRESVVLDALANRLAEGLENP